MFSAVEDRRQMLVMFRTRDTQIDADKYSRKMLLLCSAENRSWCCGE
jgi:hypothetical protein